MVVMASGSLSIAKTPKNISRKVERAITEDTKKTELAK
jgi:hypothetical protein